MTDDQTRHELISALKSLAIEIGRTPTRQEFAARIVNARGITDRLFGGWRPFIQAAGLAPERIRKTKITNEIFEVNIDSHLEHYRSSTQLLVPGREIVKPTWSEIAVLGDIHEPFSHEKLKADFVIECEKKQPDYIVQAGDGRDQYSQGKFPRSHNIFTPKEEERLATERLTELWRILHQRCPKSKLIMLCGNHDLRPLKRVIEAVPSIEHWAQKYFQELMTFDNVHSVLDAREEYVIDGIVFIHGYRTQLGAHRDYMLRNAVVGHTHRGGTSFRNIHNVGGLGASHTLWELNAGYAADPFSKGMSYTSQKMVEWTLGWGWIDCGGPRFLPYLG